MAEVTAFRNNATDYPIYGLPWTIVFPLLDADGDPVTGETCDSEISLNGDTGADCTNEGTEITFTTATNKGMYYLTLTAAEMTCDIATVTIYAANSKATPIVLYPKKLPTLLTSENAGAYDSTTTINLGTSASAIDDYYNGCIVYIYGGTGSGQVRMITDYVGSTKLATVHVAWATNPDATSDIKVYRTEQSPYVSSANVTHISGTAQTAGDIVDLINSLPQAEVVYYPTTATRTTGDNDGGTVASMLSEDGTYFATGEVTTGTFLDVTLEFATEDVTNNLQYAKIIGYYQGTGTHVVNIYRWNYLLNDWGVNIASTMRPETGEREYYVPLFERHISAGVVKLRFLHAGSTSGISNHVLNLDMARVVFAPVNGDLQSAIAEIYSLLQDVDSGVDKMADTIWDEILEGTETGRQMMRLFRAVLLGVSTGEGKTFLNAAGTSARVSALLDGLGNRTSVTTDAS